MLTFVTAIGECGLEWGPAGITRIVLPGDRRLARAHREPLAGADREPLAGAHREPLTGAPEPVRVAVAAITALLDGEPTDLRDVVLNERALEPFSWRVYAATRTIEPGRVTTYGAIARATGDPSAARAVGAALSANPYPIVVPCHRVLAADGALHGFSAPGGIATKRRMLEIERAPGFAVADDRA